jgi:glycosyltransferase involved in cell wall biosynthesis
LKPLVSILIPAYNAEAWIADTLRSALAQTWPHIEIIVVDDGSTDRTLSIVKNFEPKGVIVVTEKNRGVCAARNKAYGISRGDYIQWLDADDLLSPSKIAKQMEVMQGSQSRRTLLSSAWGYFIFRVNKARFVPTSLWCDLAPLEWLQRRWEQNLHMNPATWLTSRELAEAGGPWDTRLVGGGIEDGEYFSRVILASSGIRFVPEAKVFYRRTGFTSLGRIGRSNEKLESQLLGMRLQIGYLRSLDDSKRSRAASIDYLQAWLHNFHPNRPDLVQEVERLAADLGGRVSLPKAPWKYSWIEKLFGLAAAKDVRAFYHRGKFSTVRAWDKMMFAFQVKTDSPREKTLAKYRAPRGPQGAVSASAHERRC